MKHRQPELMKFPVEICLLHCLEQVSGMCEFED